MLAGVALVVGAVGLGTVGLGAVGLGSTVAEATPALRVPLGTARPGIVPTASQLNGIFCTSTGDCWAVGFREISSFADINLVQHWTGGKWHNVAVPSPGGTKADDFSELHAVRCTSATNCWSVGYYDKGEVDLTQALHWNGVKWAVSSTPNPGGTKSSGDYSQLSDVACTSASNCWADGQDGDFGISSIPSLNLAIHWNGKKWSKATTPDPGGTSSGDLNNLSAIRCASAKDCWAAGAYGDQLIVIDEMLHWNGKKWSVADAPDPNPLLPGAYDALSGLSCTSTTDCWAVGTYGGSGVSGYFLNEALHWNGHTWSLVTMPNPDGMSTGALNELDSVNCSAASNCWAVGQSGAVSPSSYASNEALHWKGTKWVVVNTPDPGGTVDDTSSSTLYGVRCASAKDCWAVGLAEESDHPKHDEILHWNSTKWLVSP
jgi:hypothetical protein